MAAVVLVHGVELMRNETFNLFQNETRRCFFFPLTTAFLLLGVVFLSWE